MERLLRLAYAPEPGIPGLAGVGRTSRAVWPVWKNSARHDVKLPTPPTKPEATRLWHQLRDFERRTRTPGRQDGAVTRNGLAVAHSLIFDFLNFRTGQLDPSYESIARKAAISISSVARGLQALKRIGVLTWVRRCAEVLRDGRYSLEQLSNVYVIQGRAAWIGYSGPTAPPLPDTGTWGDHPCAAREALTEAATETRLGGGTEAIIRQLEADPGNPLAAVLARLGRSLKA